MFGPWLYRAPTQYKRTGRNLYTGRAQHIRVFRAEWGGKTLFDARTKRRVAGRANTTCLIRPESDRIETGSLTNIETHVLFTT